MRLAAVTFVVGGSTIALAMLAGAGESTDADDGERRLSKNDRHINASARRLIEEGRQVFRFDTSVRRLFSAMPWGCTRPLPARRTAASGQASALRPPSQWV